MHFGLALQYPDAPYPELSKYVNVKHVRIEDPNPLGTSPCRAIAASLRRDERYFLSIDAHTLFKQDWDVTLITELNKLKGVCDKPIITTYSPYWFRDKDNVIRNQNGSTDLDTNMPIMSLRFKDETELPVGNFVLATPTWKNQVEEDYEEHYLMSAHLLFAEMQFIEDVPFDPMLTYYEENTAALRAWTRGYRMFAINKDVLWAREMFRGQDVNNSWRSKPAYYEKIVKGTLRCKDVLLGRVLGLYGAPTLNSILEYEKAANFSYKDMYTRMYSEENIKVQFNTVIKDVYALEKNRD